MASYDQVNADYQKYLGRNASQDEYSTYWANVPDYNSSYIANSPEGLAFTNKQVPGTPNYDPTAPVFAGNYTGQTQQQPASGSPSYAGGGDDSILGLLQGGMDPQQAAQIFNQKNGRTTGNEAVYYAAGAHGAGDMGTIGLPSGYAALTPGGWTWTVRSPEGAGGGGQAAAAPAAGGGGYRSDIGTSANNIAQTITPQPDPYQQEIRQMVRDRLAALKQPVDENASGIGQAVSAARDEGTRSAQDERTALAERLYAQGGTGAGLDDQQLTRQIQQSSERNAADVGGLRANLIMKQYQMQESELQQLLSMAMASGDSSSARQIQVQLAALQAAIQQEGMGIDLAEYAAGLNQQAALAGLRG